MSESSEDESDSDESAMEEEDEPKKKKKKTSPKKTTKKAVKKTTKKIKGKDKEKNDKAEIVTEIIDLSKSGPKFIPEQYRVGKNHLLKVGTIKVPADLKNVKKAFTFEGLQFVREPKKKPRRNRKDQEEDEDDDGMRVVGKAYTFNFPITSLAPIQRATTMVMLKSKMDPYIG